MTKGKIFLFKVNNVWKTKDKCFSSLKNKFKAIIISEDANTHNIVIKNNFHVAFQYIIDILKETYNDNEVPIENILFSNITDAIKIVKM